MDLFGITSTDTLSTLRRRYYDLALLCHPDRGGSADDMRVVQRSYEAAKLALEHQVEGDAKRAHVEATLDAVAETDADPRALPSFRDVFDEVHEHFNTRFHARFEAQGGAGEGGDEATDATSATDAPEGLFAADPYATQGYGDYMVVRPPVDGPLDLSPAALTYDASDVYGSSNAGDEWSEWAPMLDTPPDSPGSCDATSSTAIVRSEQASTDAWARDAFATTYTRHTRIEDFGASAAVPDAVPLTDYRRGFAPLGCGRPKTWLQSHLPSLREETWAEVTAEAAVEAPAETGGSTGGSTGGENKRYLVAEPHLSSPCVPRLPALRVPWEYQADGGGCTLQLRHRHRPGHRRGTGPVAHALTEWQVSFEPHAAGRVDEVATAAETVLPRVIAGTDAAGVPADASFLSVLSEQLHGLWTAWVGTKAEDELLPAVVQFLDEADGGHAKVKVE